MLSDHSRLAELHQEVPEIGDPCHQLQKESFFIEVSQLSMHVGLMHELRWRVLNNFLLFYNQGGK